MAQYLMLVIIIILHNIILPFVQGNLVNGEYSGKGEYRFPDGSKYQGNFTNNMLVSLLLLVCLS